MKHDLILFYKDLFGCNMEHILRKNLEESVLLKVYYSDSGEKNMTAWSKHWQLKQTGRDTSEEYFGRELLGCRMDERGKESNLDDS